MAMSERYEKALEYARKAHAGAVRKGTDIPYIEHVIETARIVSTMTDDEDVIIAALLHDIIEDTGHTADEIECNFGERVASLVKAESEDKRRDKAAGDTWMIRKQETMNHLENAEYNVKLIALADKLSNMRLSAIRYKKEGDRMWQYFNEKDKNKQGWYYKGIAKLTGEFSETPIWQEYVKLCDEVFG